MRTGRVWSIVLAGGDGVRLRDLARDAAGRPVPKQFWKMDGERTLLRSTLERTWPLVPPDRTVPVVAEQHARWWTTQLEEIPRENVVVQPANRGTAAGILLPLLRILRRDRDAVVVVLPSDHWVLDEDALRGAVVDALARARGRSERVILLGVVPERHDPEYGWIVPERTGSGDTPDVATFIEKPDAATARNLVRRGAVVNTLILAARGSTLLQLFDLTVPRLVVELVGQDDDLDGDGLARVYDRLPRTDFSREVLQNAPELLSLGTVPSCGWVDVGVPDRVGHLLRGRREKAAAARRQTAAHGRPARPSARAHG
jgi:mannose-1-phosphate guanylyltransferase